MTRFSDILGKSNYANLICMLMISVLFLACPVFATQVYQQIQVNGTGSVYNGFFNDEMAYEHIIYIDGEAYLNITYDDGSEKLVELEDYIAAKETQWAADGRGISMNDVVQALDRAARYRLGETDYLSDEDKVILSAIDAITGASMGDYLDRNIKPLSDAIRQQQKEIQIQAYEIEAIYRTLEKTDPDTYCKSRLEVAKAYDLPSVKCGLHSKRCYNGEQYQQEGGRDFCVHTEEYIEYLPCYNTFGRCGTLDSVEVLESEANSYTPVRITFTNAGKMALNPNVTIQVMEEYTYDVVKLYSQDLGTVLEGETNTFIIYFDNSGITAGRTYDMMITVQSGRKEVLDRAKLQLKPEGTFQKAGTLEVSYTEPGYKKEMQITGAYTNIANYAYSTVMNVDVFLEGKRYSSLQSESLAFKPQETRNFVVSYKPDVEGNYTLMVTIEGTDLKKISEFTVERPSITGMLITAVSNAQNTQEAINGEEKVNASNMTLTIGAIALVFSLVSTLIYWRKSSQKGKEQAN